MGIGTLIIHSFEYYYFQVTDTIYLWIGILNLKCLNKHKYLYMSVKMYIGS